MARRLIIPLLFVLVAGSSLCAGQQPVALCIVQTKTDQAIQYDPSAGPWAIETYNQLSGKKLRDGTRLKITVLPASVQNDVLPEIRRLQCARVLQIWYSQSVVTEPGAISGNHQVMAPQPRNEDSLFYTLWDGATQKVLGRGSVPLTWRSVTGEVAPNRGACAAMVQQTLKWLNRVH